jgi:hypothetical protein
LPALQTGAAHSDQFVLPIAPGARVGWDSIKGFLDVLDVIDVQGSDPRDSVANVLFQYGTELLAEGGIF